MLVSQFYASEDKGEQQHHWRPNEGEAMQGRASACCRLQQNQVLLTALEVLQARCAGLRKENSFLRKSCFPETQEKVRQLKRKNAELAVIAKRLEERAQKLQEANLKVVNAPVAVKGSCTGLCRKALARQQATDLRERASLLLAKDKQISALQQECQELQAKISSGKGGPHPPLQDFRQLLRESQKEVLRLQRQIALKEAKASRSPGLGDAAVALAAGSGPPTRAAFICSNGFAPQQRDELPSATEAAGKTGLAVAPGSPQSPKEGVAISPEIKQQIQQLESELRKKRKQCENLEHEVRKKHKKYAELEIRLQDVQNNNFRLSEENSLLHGQVRWTEKVESENADLRRQVAVVTEERDLARQEARELQSRLESLGQVLERTREVAERSRQLEREHEEALEALREKRDEVHRLRQAQEEARSSHEGAVQLLEVTSGAQQARVRELEDQCRSHAEQFSCLSQELRWFRLHAGKTDLLLLSPPPSLETSGAAFTACPSGPPLPDGSKEEGPEDVPESLQRNRKVRDDEAGGFSQATPLLAGPGLPAVARSPGTGVPPLASKKAAKKPESQSSSSRSDSPQNSPKSCSTPEVDTASEVEELEVDSVSLAPETTIHSPMKLRVFLARYSYDPFDGPNENPEAELPLTAGEYIYVYGEMDEDGFFEGELVDGRRGLVPSNFVERISDADLVTPVSPELQDLSPGSPLERSFLSPSISSGGRSDWSTEEPSCSATPSWPAGPPGEGGAPRAVPCPRKVTLLERSGGGLVVGWEPPLPAPGAPAIQSYSVYVDDELRQATEAGAPTRAVLEDLDLESRSYRVSVQSVSEGGRSNGLQCTVLAGRDVALAPSRLTARSLTAMSAEVCWAPCSSNFPHTVYLDGEECGTTRAGTHQYTFRCLQPDTSYVAAVEVRPQPGSREPALSEPDQPLSAEIRFTTPPAGSPDAPLDVRVEPGPMPGILVISWLPVTIDAEGSSNGLRVTGYAVYADGQKVMEVTSPTAGSVLAEVSQLQILQVCREVSVRTVSLYGESADSVPAQLPSASPEVKGCPARSSCSCLAAQLSHGPPRALLTTPASQACGTEPSSATGRSVARSTPQASPCETPVEASLNGCPSPTRTPAPPATLSDAEAGTPPGEEGPPASRTMSEDPAIFSKAAQDQPGEDRQGQLLVAQQPDPGVPGGSASEQQSPACSSMDQGAKESPAQRGVESEPSSPGAKSAPPSRPSGPGESRSAELGQSERHSPDSTAASPARVKLLKEVPREDSAALTSRVKREQGEKRSDPGNHPMNLLADHSRGSDLSDIMEEEEEEEEGEEEEEEEEKELQHSGRQGEARWSLGEYHGRENGEKLVLGDPDSDEELLERVVEAPSPASRSKALFSIPEVAEEEEEDDDGWAPAPGSPRAPSPPGSRAAGSLPEAALGPPRRTEVAGSSNPDPLGCAPWQGPIHSGRRPQRQRRAALALSSSGAGRSPSPELRDSRGPARLFVALFDYDPASMSPNADAAEEELPFREGQILKVYGRKDADGFYQGENGGRTGYIPCNMVSEVQVDSDGVRKQLLQEGHLPARVLAETLGNGTFSPPPPPPPWLPGSRPPKPRRSKKVAQDQLEGEFPGFGVPDRQDLSSDEDTPRTMVTILDYSPRERSPDPDTEGEINGRKGLVPSNFLQVTALGAARPGEPSLGRQVRRSDWAQQRRQVLCSPAEAWQGTCPGLQLSQFRRESPDFLAMREPF
ncbi:peripheral-type benzodiazepine receptor-associated protein 1 [Varanus komodoensis]|uniref:peripheral-type benzodiazepine receptor-associated protein 1 n=1 Tax=Varanus komodoensis TaxID=61221 RepID=UPI001CF7A84C|nr:peripheral-type benzodiazepine receptor-associated protein 1 [Varanus komodoensis]